MRVSDKLQRIGKRRGAMRMQRIFQDTIICVNGKCFDDSLSASRYFMELASRGQRVSVIRRVKADGVESKPGEAEADLMPVSG
jgi:hypothetical protein